MTRGYCLRVMFVGGSTSAIAGGGDFASRLAGLAAASWMAASRLDDAERSSSGLATRSVVSDGLDGDRDDDARGDGDHGGANRPKISQLKSGDSAAWRWFVNEFGQAIINYAARMGHPDPDEVMGSTLETVARGIARFEGNHKQLRSYVFSVAHARLVDETRKSARRTNLGADYLDDIASSDSNPEQALGAGFDNDVLVAALDRLSEDQRTMLYLRYVEGLSTKETARAVGKSEVATRVALSRGLTQLRNVLSEGESVR